MMNKILIVLLIVANGIYAQNKLTKKEKKAGWQLLFDGKTTNGWVNYNKTTIGSAWKVVDGTLMLDTLSKVNWQVKDGGDIVTTQSFENYELIVDWKISPKGNSGIIFNVKEDMALEYVWHSGPEMQIADPNHPDSKIFKHAAGDLYDLIPSPQNFMKPFPAWNTARIVNNKGLLQCFLNGNKTAEVRIDSEQWKELIKGSKFKAMPHFGKYLTGKISLQDHGDAVWFRNIKIRKL